MHLENNPEFLKYILLYIVQTNNIFMSPVSYQFTIIQIIYWLNFAFYPIANLLGEN